VQPSPTSAAQCATAQLAQAGKEFFFWLFLSIASKAIYLTASPLFTG